ncbi:MAG: acetyl-CoA carboxylase biotin carboxyl carrier protein [Alphaproteobacteria bacterium]
MKIDSEAIRELADLIKETGLTEIEVVDGDKAIRVSKNVTMMAAGSAPMAANYTMPSGPVTPQQLATDAQSQGASSSYPGAVKSPMVGTVYMQSEPGSPPFVKKGDHVNVGDTLLIIEAMKVMNPIKSEKSGTVMQVLIENGEPVEFGDVLLVIE